jgi:hypothetical protein
LSDYLGQYNEYIKFRRLFVPIILPPSFCPPASLCADIEFRTLIADGSR